MIVSILRNLRGSVIQVIAAVLCNLNGISDGIAYGWTSPSLAILRSPSSTVKIEENDEVWLESLYVISSLAGFPLSIYLFDVIGRKKLINFSLLIELCGWVLVGIGSRVEHLFIGRFLIGLSQAVVYVVCPVYVSEITYHKQRALLSGMMYNMMLLGFVIISAIGSSVSIQTTSFIAIGVLIIQIVLFPFMPESPYYLLYKDNEDDAKLALEVLRGNKDIDAEFLDIQAAVSRQKTERGRFQDLFKIKSNRKAAVITLMMYTMYQFSNSSVIIMNLQDIFLEAGSPALGVSKWTTIFSLNLLISSLFAISLVDKLGRRILLLLSGVSSSVLLIFIGVYFHLRDMEYKSNAPVLLFQIAILAYAVTIELGLAILPPIVVSEIFPLRVKRWGSTLGSLIFIVSATLSIHAYDFTKYSGKIFLSYYFSGIYCLIASIIIFFYLPETKGKTLEEIQMMLKGLQ